MDIREELCAEVIKQKKNMIDLCIGMVKIPSETPPSDTRKIAEFVYNNLKDIPEIELNYYTESEPVRNLVAVIKSGKPGKRLVFNGHLDTYPVGNVDEWNELPWSGVIKDNFIYGRGSSDMKGGIACFITAAKILANRKDLWSGEIVLTLAGDEEAMGTRGSKFLLDTVPEATGDAMICADVGAPNSLRFGEKGLFWFKLVAKGKPAHGAHLHKGENAINNLIKAINALNEELPKLPVNAPEKVTKAILDGSKISEQGAGPGETDILQKVTVNFGTINGGTSPNLVPSNAIAEADVRIPAGVTIKQVEDKINEVLTSTRNVSYFVMRSYEANWSDVDDTIFKIVKSVSEEILKEEVVVTFRVGASDARLYRLIKGVPSINCGLTPYGLGGPNEHVSIAEMVKITQIHILSALDFLNSK